MQTLNPAYTVHQIITILATLATTHTVNIILNVENTDGYQRLDMQGIQNPGENLTLRHYNLSQGTYQLADETTVDDDYRQLRDELLHRITSSSTTTDLTEIELRILYPEATLAPAGRLTWNFGHGRILLGPLH